MKYLIGALIAIVIAVLITFFVIKALKPNLDEQSKEQTPGKNAGDKPKSRWKTIFNEYKSDLVRIAWITVGLTAINFLFYFSTTAHPEYWQWYWSKQAAFWSWNVGAVMIIFLGSKKDAKGKIEPTAATIRSAVMWIMFASLALNFFDKPATANNKPPSKSEAKAKTPAFDKGRHAPMEISRSIIGGCESGDGTPGSGRQFEADGKTPTKNRRGSSAFGIYQFLEEHRKPAHDLGFDLNTKEGQDGYFAYRYDKLGLGTQDWEADPESRSCWEPKLRAYMAAVGKPSGTISLVPSYDQATIMDPMNRLTVFKNLPASYPEERERLIAAPVGDWSEIINTPPHGHKNIEIDDGAGDTKNYSIIWNGMRTEKFPREEGAKPKTPDTVYFFRIRSDEAEPLIIKIKFR